MTTTGESERGEVARVPMCGKAQARRFTKCTLPAGHGGGHGVMCFRSREDQERLLSEYAARAREES